MITISNYSTDLLKEVQCKGYAACPLPYPLELEEDSLLNDMYLHDPSLAIAD